MSSQIVPFILMFVVMIVFMILPKQREMKKENEFLTSLKVGDKIITKSGIHGKIAEISEATLIIETMSGKLKIERSAVSREFTASLNKK